VRPLPKGLCIIAGFPAPPEPRSHFATPLEEGSRWLVAGLTRDAQCEEARSPAWTRMLSEP